MKEKIQVLIANFEKDIDNIEKDKQTEDFCSGFHEGLIAALKKSIEELNKILGAVE